MGRFREQTFISKQQGVFKLLHSLLLVALVVGGIMLYRNGKLPYINYRPDFPRWVESDYDREQPEYVQTHMRRPVEREDEDADYTDARYAVQVGAAYDSRSLYDLRDALRRDGYDAYLVSLNTSQGMLFKLRVGAYDSRRKAERVRNRIRGRYSRLGDSFVVQGE